MSQSRLTINRDLHNEIDRPIYQMAHHETDSGDHSYEILSVQCKRDECKTGRQRQQYYHNRT